MKSLLLSPTLMDLSLRRDLHLSIVLQVTASVPESFVEIGVWGGVKKKKKRPDKCPGGKKGPSVCVLVMFASLHSRGNALCNGNLSWGLNKITVGQNLLITLFVELWFSFRLGLPALTSSSCFLGYQYIQANQSARFKHGICITATDLA